MKKFLVKDLYESIRHIYNRNNHTVYIYENSVDKTLEFMPCPPNGATRRRQELTIIGNISGSHNAGTQYVLRMYRPEHYEKMENNLLTKQEIKYYLLSL